MGRFVKGDLVVLEFPVSDLTDTIRRPALVVAELSGNDRILCQITSQDKHSDAIKITRDDCVEGGLPKISYVRPNKLFTADKSIILERKGHLKPEIVNIVTTEITKIISK